MPPETRTYESSDRTVALEGVEFFNLIPDALLIVDSGGTIRYGNVQATTMFGYADHELLGLKVEVLIPEQNRQRHVHTRNNYQLNPTIRQMGKGLPLRACRKDSSEFPVDVMLSPMPSSAGLTLAIVRDMTISAMLQDDLRRLAYFDTLTNLPNKTSLYKDLGALLFHDLTQATSQLAIVSFDLDGFKDVNDTFGHSAGDELLKCVAQRWVAVSSDELQIYRFGGDEFIVLIPGGGDPRRIAEIVERMLQALKAPFQITGRTVYIGASAGIANTQSDGCDVETLLANVDLALYSAKSDGCGHYAFFHSYMRKESQARQDIDLKLRHALSDGEFELYYQAQVRLADSSLVGAEALLRWHSGGNIVLPGAFIKALSQNPAATEVGSWILRKACETVAAWRSKSLLPVRIAVNLFESQFRDPSFANQVENILVETKLPPDALILEITENVAFSSGAAMLAVLRKLRNVGVGLALDDFGTGYGSLSDLIQMPLTHLKIDQQFVRGIGVDEKCTAVVRLLVALAKNFKLEVIAEGVETDAQASFLRAEGCDQAQGFLFARPVSASAFETTLGTACG